MQVKNVGLIGMPGAGKSTVGVVLAKALAKVFVDTDLLIQQARGCLLQELICAEGVGGFLAAEEQVVLGLQTENAVIATGGSVVYSALAMQHLKTQGWIVYLKLPLAVVEQRIDNMASRGIAMAAGQKFSDLYWERAPLYEKYADLVVEASALTLEETVAAIVRRLKNTR
ncbi:MAG TPA: shikimate kinase [Bacillota bacterium]|nr:shikimate kinase [Bacillota bacterium]